MTVVAILPSAEDRSSLTEIFHHHKWGLKLGESLAGVATLLKQLKTGVVISACNLPDGDWKSVLHAVGREQDPLPMIVASRLTNAQLWAEVLSLGGYDVLTTPFDATEVVRSISSAWQHSQDKRRVAMKNSYYPP
jgi:DNA-binding NtrC family response regulator